VIGLGAATRIYVATGATDMRKSFDGLYGLVRERLECDPTNGHLYLFANARRDRMKILFFDGASLWVCARRMECGRLRWPEAEGVRAAFGRHRSYSDATSQVVSAGCGRGLEIVMEKRMNTDDFFTYPQENLLQKKHRECDATIFSAVRLRSRRHRDYRAITTAT
jgi:hypothetical protein